MGYDCIIAHHRTTERRNLGDQETIYDKKMGIDCPWPLLHLRVKRLTQHEDWKMSISWTELNLVLNQKLVIQLRGERSKGQLVKEYRDTEPDRVAHSNK